VPSAHRWRWPGLWRTGAKGKNKGLNLATQRGRRRNGGTGEKSMDEKSEIRAAKNEKWRSNRGVSHGAETQFDEYFRLADVQKCSPIAMSNWPFSSDSK
jgi:hypothetical protein